MAIVTERDVLAALVACCREEDRAVRPRDVASWGGWSTLTVAALLVHLEHAGLAEYDASAGTGALWLPTGEGWASVAA